MFKNIVLALSLLFNAAIIFVILNAPTSREPKMSCKEAMDERLNKAATLAFSNENNNSFEKTHEFLRNSGYSIRNVGMKTGGYPLRNLETASESVVSFIYTAHGYRKPCGIPFPSFFGNIVRVHTNIQFEPQIIDVE